MKENLRDINQKLEKKNESTRLNSVNSRAEKHFCVYIYIYIYIYKSRRVSSKVF